MTTSRRAIATTTTLALLAVMAYLIVTDSNPTTNDPQPQRPATSPTSPVVAPILVDSSRTIVTTDASSIESMTDEPGNTTGGDRKVEETTFIGRALDADSAPISECEVSVGQVLSYRYRDGDEPKSRKLTSGFTNGEGRFELTVESRDLVDGNALIRLERTSYEITEKRISGRWPIPGVHDFGDILLTDGYSIEGIVVDPRGAAIGGVEILTNYDQLESDPISSDSLGRFRLSSIPAGELRIRANRSSYTLPGNWFTSIEIPEGGPPEPIVVEMIPTAPVEFIVRDSLTGETPRNIIAVVAWEEGSETHSRSYNAFLGGVHSPLIVKNAPADYPNLRARPLHPLYAVVDYVPVPPDTRRLEFDLVRLPCIEVTVVDSETQKRFRPDVVRLHKWINEWEFFSQRGGPFEMEKANDTTYHRNLSNGSLHYVEESVGRYFVPFHGVTHHISYGDDTMPSAPPFGISAIAEGYETTFFGPRFLTLDEPNIGPWELRMKPSK